MGRTKHLSAHLRNINNSDYKSAPLIVSITVHILTGFVTFCFNAHHLSQHINPTVLSQVEDKQEWRDNRNYTIVKNATIANIYVLLGELWWNVGRTQEVMLYSSVNDNIAHIAVQLQLKWQIQQLCFSTQRWR